MLISYEKKAIYNINDQNTGYIALIIKTQGLTT